MDWQTVRSRHILVVLVFVDWRGLVRTGVTNLHPTFVAIVSVVLIMLPVVGIMFHSYMAHHVVHALPDFFCKCPTHINRRSFEVARRFSFLLLLFVDVFGQTIFCGDQSKRNCACITMTASWLLEETTQAIC